MAELRPYNLFIGHAWRYGEQYDRLIELLRNAPHFSFLNWSAPEDKPVIPPGTWGPTARILAAIRQKMRMAQIVPILAGMYAAHSVWMKAEIQLARELSKPMIGIRPWGNRRMPTDVLMATMENVGWNTSSIIRAIRTHALPRS